MVIIGDAGSGQATDLVPSGQVAELVAICMGGFGISHRGCGAGEGLENQTRAGLCC